MSGSERERALKFEPNRKKLKFECKRLWVLKKSLRLVGEI